MKRSRGRRLLFVVVTVTVVMAGSVAVYWYRDYGDDFRARKGTYAAAVVTPRGADSVFERSWATVTSNSGLQVVCGMLVPRRENGSAVKRYPAIVLLGGKATGKYAVDYALDIRDVIVVSPDYPYEPRESYSAVEFVRDIPAMRRAFLDMVPSAMLLTDYLWSRDDVDTSRLVMLGYSFGAPFVPCILANDRRSALAAIVFGGGDLQSLIRHNVARYEGSVASYVAGGLGAMLLRPLEPMRYIEHISPTPLLMINGAQDEQIPRENAELLYRAAREPKEIVWLESRHVRPDNIELTRTIVRELKKGLVARGILIP